MSHPLYPVPVCVHVLLHRLPLCGFDKQLPAAWPEGHQWVSLRDWAEATCITCWQLAQNPELVKLEDKTPFGNAREVGLLKLRARPPKKNPSQRPR